MIRELRTERDDFREFGTWYKESAQENTKLVRQIESMKAQLDTIEEEDEEETKEVEEKPPPPPQQQPDKPRRKKERSSKLPDPPLFKGDDNPSWDEWSTAVEHKLRANRDHYDNESMRIAYVAGRTTGKPNDHIRPRLSRRSKRPYETVDELLDHLSEIYEDPTQDSAARAQLASLRQGAMPFKDFYAEFDRLTGLAGITNDQTLRDELANKLNTKMFDYMDGQPGGQQAYTSVNQMRATCLRRDNNMRSHALLVSMTRDNRDRDSKPEPKAKETRPVRKSTYVIPQRATAETPKATTTLDASARVPRSKMTCYGCGQEGHLRGDPKCPVGQQTDAGRGAQEAKINEINSNTDSGLDDNDIIDGSSSSGSENE